MAKKQKPALRKPKSAAKRVPLLSAKPKERIFTMTWEVNTANAILEKYHKGNGTFYDENGEEVEVQDTPIHIYCSAYQGDYSLASKAGLIHDESSFYIKSNVHAVNKSTGETLDCEYKILCYDRLTLLEFLSGESSDNGEIIVKEKDKEETTWRGFFTLLEEYLAEFSNEFELVTNHCELICKNSFLSAYHAKVFESLKLIHAKPIIMKNAQQIA